MSKKSYFDAALSDFLKDFASGDSIRAYADKGYTVEEIHSLLDFPVERNQIGEIVWKQFIDTKVISLINPDEISEDSVSYEKVYDAYGKASFKQVRIAVSNDFEYVACDFGKIKYKDVKSYEEMICKLDKKDAEYLNGLPWPLQTVWHRKDERIMRIIRNFHTPT